MPRYSFRLRRSAPVVEPEPTYRDLQAEAKERGIAANQSADDLKAALAEDDADVVVEDSDGE